jgi:hypothetical protein
MGWQMRPEISKLALKSTLRSSIALVVSGFAIAGDGEPDRSMAQRA